MGASDPLVALTAGEPAGIGPDLCAILAGDHLPGRLVIVGDRAVVAGRAAARGLPFEVSPYAGRASAPVSLLHVPAPAPVVAGRTDPANAKHVLAILDQAIDGCLAGEFDAMVTGPVQKSVLNEAGIAFTGHTEYLAERTHAAQVVMLLAGAGLRVALATTHLPLRRRPRRHHPPAAALRARGPLTRTCARGSASPRPRILVCGLNPHAGEARPPGPRGDRGHRTGGRGAARRGLDVRGPLPADTAVHPGRARHGRRGARDVPRPGAAGAQARRLRGSGQRHAGTAVHPHLGRPRHGAGPGGKRRASTRAARARPSRSPSRWQRAAR